MQRLSSPNLFKSIRFKLVAVTFGILLLLWLYFIYNNLYAIRVIRTQVAESSQKLVSLYMQSIDRNLNSIEMYISNILTTNTDIVDMQYQQDPARRNAAKFQLFRRLSGDIVQYNYINSIFVYAVETDDYFSVYSMSSVDYATQENVNLYIKALLQDPQQRPDLSQTGYFSAEITGKYYIFRILNYDQMYIGTWVSADLLKEPLVRAYEGTSTISLFMTADGVPMNNQDFVTENQISLPGRYDDYYLTGARVKYLAIGQASSYENFSLVILIPDKAILENLGYFNQLALIISLFFIILIPLYVFFLRKSLFSPLQAILNVINRIKEGSLDERISYPAKSPEFTMINASFNGMMDQIHTLKINVYEEQISKQKEEAENLRLQISPHFFMNSLHIIYSLAQIKDFALVQEMSLCLFRYFSYISRKKMSLVKLSEEINHIRNYLRIMELRFINGFTYSIEAPEELLEVLIPPLSVQTFIENTMKYALTMDEVIELSVKVEPCKCASGAGVRIAIYNSGQWIREDILKNLQTGQRIVDEQGEHIGIWNVYRRLQIAYEGKASLMINNIKPKGVLAEMLVPWQADIPTAIPEREANKHELSDPDR